MSCTWTWAASCIETPLHEMRIAAVHRGAGPKDVRRARLGELRPAPARPGRRAGARACVRARVGRRRRGGRAAACRSCGTGSARPTTCWRWRPASTRRCSSLRGRRHRVRAPRRSRRRSSASTAWAATHRPHLGSSMHVFLLDIPRLEFAAIIPKGDYVTVCMLGDDIDNALVAGVPRRAGGARCFPPDWRAGGEFVPVHAAHQRPRRRSARTPTGSCSSATAA